MPTSASGRKSKHRSPTERRRDREGPDGNASTASAHAAPAAPEPNLDASDPYAILGVSRSATSQEIKLSYRKLALRHHPDRQRSDADKEAAHRHFAAIGNAYEILGDEGRRREYDAGMLRQQYQQPQRQPGSGRSGGDVFAGFGSDPFFSDPFFASPFGGFGGRSSSSSRSAFHFTDPFELFEQFFAEEMGHHSRAHRSAARASDPFASDPFFSDGSFSDPFFSSGGSLFGRGGMGQMMSSHFDRASSMMSHMHSGSLLGDMDPQHQFSSSSSSFSNRNGGQHQSVSTSTKTTIVNGVRKMVTERTVVHPDGRVDRHVETIEGDGNDGTGRLTSGSRPALDYGEGKRQSRR
ncbi:hypothetical protein ACHAXT_002473 [Thalassiosira profunda]